MKKVLQGTFMEEVEFGVSLKNWEGFPCCSDSFGHWAEENT